jgi:hypothetical protein
MPRQGKLSRLYPYYCGSVRFNQDTLPPTLPTHLAECLRRAGAWEVTVDDNHVAFKASMVGTIGDVLAPFGCGDLEVDGIGREVRYRLRTVHMPIIATVVTCFFAVILLAVGFFPRIALAAFLPLVWVWFAGGGILIAVPRFDAFLRRSISSAPKPAAGDTPAN